MFLVAGMPGAPGATTVALALAVAWPVTPQPLVIEADPDGGVLAARLGLSVEPGLLSLAGTRRSLRPDALLEHAQHAPFDVPVVCAPAGAGQASLAVDALCGQLPQLAAGFERDLLVDAGRLVPSSPLARVVAEADRLVLVARPCLEQLHLLGARLATLAGVVAAIDVVLIGRSPYRSDEVLRAISPPRATVVVHDMALDVRGAHAITGQRVASPRVLRRSTLVRQAGVLARHIREQARAKIDAAPERGIA